MKPKTVLLTALLFVFAIFVAQNAEDVEVKFLLWSINHPRALVLIATFLLGYIAGWLPGLIQGRRETRTEAPPRAEGKKEPKIKAVKVEEDQDLAEGEV